jgi:prolyl oligopeptidase
MAALPFSTLTILKKRLAPLSPPSETIIDGIYGATDALYMSSRNGVAKNLSRLAYRVGATLERIALPVEGSTFGIDASMNHDGIVFGLQSWIIPPIVYRYDLSTHELVDTKLQSNNPLDLSGFQVREVQTTSTDDARVPISIIFRKGIALDGSHPTLFEGYGCYGVPIEAEFNPSYFPGILAWVERGGVFAVAHVRGGGEYGERWHLDGQKATKQHTVDDMLATARYLISNKYTSPARLAVRGTSAGGIAEGNCIVQHPELFAAAIHHFGYANMLRLQFTESGPANIPEFGDATKPDEFKWLYAMSAYDHVKDGTKYPAVLALTGINDTRVPSWIVAEFAARLQRATSSGKPVLLRVDFDAGHHSLGSNRVQLENTAADEQAFLLWQFRDKQFNSSTAEHQAKAD